MIRVGVIRGGVSPEYDVSLRTGGHVLSHLRADALKDKYTAIDMLLDKNGILHANGRPTDMADVHKKVDVVFNALHGDFGEDGKFQQLLEQWKIPYTGSGIFSSALGYNKKMAKDRFRDLGLKTPEHMLFPFYQPDFDGPEEDYPAKKAREVWQKMPAPWIVKPLTGGSSMGVHACKTFPELVRAFEVGMRQGVSVVVEELILGKEATVGVVENFRNKPLYTFPAVEIRLHKNKNSFDYEDKYYSPANRVAPGNFSLDEKVQLEYLAKLIHTEFNLDHYSTTDFIVHPKRGIYVLEVNTLPGLTPASTIPQALESVGSNMPEFIDHIIKLALSRK